MTIQNVTGMFLLAVALMLRESDAFVNVASAPRCSSRAATTAMSASAGLTRAEAIQRAAAGSGVLAAGVLLGGPVPQARAGEEMMKDEVQQFAELRGQVEKKGRDEVVKENLAILTEATGGLKTLDVFIGEKDYQALRLALRNPPIGNLRTSARKVIINIDNKEAEERATTAYKALIKSVDKLDVIANTGMKAKDGLKDDKQLLEVYGACVDRGSDLMTLLPTIL